jgi:hypothetical protein
MHLCKVCEQEMKNHTDEEIQRCYYSNTLSVEHEEEA